MRRNKKFINCLLFGAVFLISLSLNAAKEYVGTVVPTGLCNSFSVNYYHPFYQSLFNKV